MGDVLPKRTLFKIWYMDSCTLKMILEVAVRRRASMDATRKCPRKTEVNYITTSWGRLWSVRMLAVTLSLITLFIICHRNSKEEIDSNPDGDGGKELLEENYLYLALVILGRINRITDIYTRRVIVESSCEQIRVILY